MSKKLNFYQCEQLIINVLTLIYLNSNFKPQENMQRYCGLPYDCYPSCCCHEREHSSLGYENRDQFTSQRECDLTLSYHKTETSDNKMLKERKNDDIPRITTIYIESKPVIVWVLEWDVFIPAVVRTQEGLILRRGLHVDWSVFPDSEKEDDFFKV